MFKFSATAALASIAICLFTPARADTLEKVGTGVAIALPVAAAGITFAKHDRKGLGQLILETGLTVGTTFALKQVVREKRPDGSDWQSFPSDTTALSASGSSFLWGRYGWEYGVPAVAMSEFVAYTRVEARQHHWYDTLASTAIAGGYGYFVTTPFQRRYGIRTAVAPFADGAALQFSYNF